jgi:hypothetical protein
MIENWNTGSSCNAGPGVSGPITDCSVWDADIANHGWSEGFSRNAGPAASGSTTDCSGWVREASVSIAIQLTYPHDVDRETVATRIHSLVESIKELDPPLGLEYDEKRSEQNVSAREVRIVLVPTRTVEDVADRVWDLLGRVRKLELKSLGIHNAVSVSYNCMEAA